MVIELQGSWKARLGWEQRLSTPLLLGGSVLLTLCSSSEFQEGDPDVHLRAGEHAVFQAVSFREEAQRCVFGKVERTLDPIYNPAPSSFLPEDPECWGKEGLLGVEQDAGASALSSLLLLLQVLGALFLAIGLWAWGEKVRWWGRAWGCCGSKWWEDHTPICICSPGTGRSVQHLSADRPGRL